MKLNEAYSILNLSSNASPEEAKKQYKKLTLEFHPDVNKEPEAEDKFKKINEAYQVVSTGKSTDREEMHRQQSHEYNPFGKQHIYQNIENVILNTTISFKDSVLGCKKELKFNRRIKCKDCNGEGETTINNGCDKCGGRGQIVGKQSNMVFIRTCDKCGGRSQTISCKICNSSGNLEAETSINVSIPGGIQNDNILRLSGMGHFIGNFGPMEQYTDAYLHVKVTSESGLSSDGTYVISTLELSLLEALQGCQKKIKTVLGNKNIKIEPMARHKDEIIINNVGINHSGSQKVILDVQYPKESSVLIEALSQKEK